MCCSFRPYRSPSSFRPLVWALLLGVALPAFAERSYPPDCLPDRVVAWAPVSASPSTLFGASWVPGVVLGPPGDSDPLQNSFSVTSFGFGGSITVAFDQIVLEDGPGPDFIVFENAFFRPPIPTSAADDFTVFAEPGIVEVSADGVNWQTFPFDAAALAQVPDVLDGSTSKALALQLGGLAGITPTFTGNWTVPDDPAVFDPAGVGGVSGAGGDAFDLADVGLAEARFLRITDADTHAGFTGNAEGFDLDAVVALHARPVRPSGLDSDGDGLSDEEEQKVFGTDPARDDSDGDGIDDGREVAACRDPSSAGIAAVFHHEPRLWLLDATCTEARWSFAGTNALYDLLRGDLGSIAPTANGPDLGPTLCLADDELTVRWSCDTERPLAGEAFYYLVRVDGAGGFGRGSALDPRGGAVACP